MSMSTVLSLKIRKKNERNRRINEDIQIAQKYTNLNNGG